MCRKQQIQMENVAFKQVNSDRTFENNKNYKNISRKVLPT